MKAKYKKYVHYGHDRFDPEKVKQCGKVNEFYLSIKPLGIWASPKNAGYSWKEWCESEDYFPERYKKGFYFRLSKNAKVLHLHTISDAREYLLGEGKYKRYATASLDTEKIYRNYDAVELHMSEDPIGFKSNFVFNTWDVDSICVWNPDVIVPCGVVRAS